jgi:osmoprotectant transport system ATP-binding protein
MTSADVAISLRDVTKRYDGAAGDAVGGLSLDVRAGEIVALVGPSGCGKTTTLKMINRLIEPTTGTIEVLGRDQRALPAHDLRRQIGYVIQQVGLFPHRTIASNIGTVPDLLGWDSQRMRARVEELTELVGLDAAILDRYPAELSGGQQQRVGVARALAADPPILLMDEPYSAVDPVVRERLQDELLALQSRLHKTIVFVTHDIEEALRLADRIAILEDGGRLAQYDTPDRLLAEPASPFVSGFLGRERGLRRLALIAVGDLALPRIAVVTSGASVASAVEVLDTVAAERVVVADGERIIGVARRHELDAFPADVAIGSRFDGATVPIVHPSMPAREALDVLLSAGAASFAAVRRDGAVTSVVALDDIAAVLGGVS